MELKKFRENENKYALGVCNGFQLLTLLGWFDDILENIFHTLKVDNYKIKITNNNSKDLNPIYKYKISNTSSPFLENNIGDILGVWVLTVKVK